MYIRRAGWQKDLSDPSALLDVSPTSPHLCNVFLMIDSLFIFFIITIILMGVWLPSGILEDRIAQTVQKEEMLRIDFALAFSMWSQIILRIPVGLISSHLWCWKISLCYPVHTDPLIPHLVMEKQRMEENIKIPPAEDFSGSPVVKTPCSHCRGLGSDPPCSGK